jgi:hypothetical protein
MKVIEAHSASLEVNAAVDWAAIAQKVNSEMGLASPTVGAASPSMNRSRAKSDLPSVGSPSATGAVPWAEIADELNAGLSPASHFRGWAPQSNAAAFWDEIANQLNAENSHGSRRQAMKSE